MNYRESTLLTRNNHKTIKGEKMGYITYIMYLSPFTDNSKGINLCSHASVGCSSACLFKSGMGGMYARVQGGRRNKTEWYLANRTTFMAKLVVEINAAIKRHKDKATLAFRLNGTSDIPFEKIKVSEGKNIFELFPDVQFYDYTKNPIRFYNELPSNYHLTFSRSETNHDVAMDILSMGYNVAMVFSKVPETFEGYTVINGDESDLRFKDAKGVIVGLKYKVNTGKGSELDNAFAKVSGFVLSV
jgi:hypothetical protein